MGKTAASLFLVCFVVYHVNGRPHPEVDCVAAPYTAWSMVRYRSLDLQFYPELKQYIGFHIRELPDGSWVSMRPPGSAFAVVPVVAPFAALHAEPLRATNMHHLGKLAAAASVAGAAVLFFMMCRILAPSAAWPATLLFAFGTCLWSVASQAIWMHGPATFWLCCGLYFLSRGETRPGISPIAAGAALGLAVLTRPTTVFFALATAAALLLQRRSHDTAKFVVGAAIPVSVLVLLNWTYFDSPAFGGYAADNWTARTPLWLGVGGLLVAPSRGVLVYSPALILIVPGIAALIRGKDARWTELRAVLLAWLLAAGATLWFYARWHDWWGGWSYGPRHLLETMPILCLMFALGYESLQRAWQRRLAKGLVVLSIAVHFVGVFGYSGYASWQFRHNLADQGRSLFATRDTQIEAHTRAFFGKMRLLVQSPTR